MLPRHYPRRWVVPDVLSPNERSNVQVITERYEVRRRNIGPVTMSKGLSAEYQEEGVIASIWREGRFIAGPINLNCTTMCLPGHHVRGIEATDEEVIQAVIGDEHIYTGAPSFPDEVTA